MVRFKKWVTKIVGSVEVLKNTKPAKPKTPNSKSVLSFAKVAKLSASEYCRFSNQPQAMIIIHPIQRHCTKVE